MQRADLLRKQLDVELITSLDRDGKGVDKLEFVMGMLIMMGVEVAGQALTWDSVKPFLVVDAMDTTKSGRIDKEVQRQRITLLLSALRIPLLYSCFRLPKHVGTDRACMRTCYPFFAGPTQNGAKESCGSDHTKDHQRQTSLDF